jgi:hypothetical protein
MFNGCWSLSKILGTMALEDAVTQNQMGSIFKECYSLKEVRLKYLNTDLVLSDSSVISKASILYIIQNAKSSDTKKTITLNDAVYERLINNSDITNVLNQRSDVVLKPTSDN